MTMNVPLGVRVIWAGIVAVLATGINLGFAAAIAVPPTSRGDKATPLEKLWLTSAIVLFAAAWATIITGIMLLPESGDLQ